MISIEGYPFIIRFKTLLSFHIPPINLCIEGYPFIIRFKTPIINNVFLTTCFGIEGYPFIIRFKTRVDKFLSDDDIKVLRVIHL